MQENPHTNYIFGENLKKGKYFREINKTIYSEKTKTNYCFINIKLAKIASYCQKLDYIF